MKKVPDRLPAIVSKILTVLVQTDDYMTTAEVAKEASVSWNTALTHLKSFHAKGWVEKAGDTTVYWRAIVEG